MPKVISHKYANDIISYMMIYIQLATLGPLQKKEKVEEKVELRMFHLNPQRGAPLSGFYATSLQCTLTTTSSKDAEIGGHLGLIKHSGERKLGESGIESRTYGWSP